MQKITLKIKKTQPKYESNAYNRIYNNNQSKT